MFHSVVALILSQLGLCWPQEDTAQRVGLSVSLLLLPRSFLGTCCWLGLPLSVLALTLLEWRVALGSYSKTKQFKK